MGRCDRRLPARARRQGRCPIANLLGQLGERDDGIRAVLASGYDCWEADIRAGFAAIVESGELRLDADIGSRSCPRLTHPSSPSRPARTVRTTPAGEIRPHTRQWLHDLDAANPSRPDALSRLHQNLLRGAYAEIGRRRGHHPLGGPELDDLAHQAADDALVAITAKLAEFRGESRFTTWAYRFVILEVSSKLGRHFWQRPTVAMEPTDWECFPSRFGTHPDDHAERVELVAAVRLAVTEELTDHQRHVFVALVVDGVPLDALAIRPGSSRNAIYKTIFDAHGRHGPCSSKAETWRLPHRVDG